MAHSLEIRVPLVDVELFRQMAPLSALGRATKQEMALAPAKPLAQRVIERGKTGFSIPVRDWLRQAGSGNTVPRGIRGWARRIQPPARKAMRVLALVTDAFGGHGGIANYNRDFLSALCAHEAVGELTVFVRHAPRRHEALPKKLSFVTSAAGSKIHFAMAVLKYAIARPRTDLVVCGHINLLPLAFFLRSWFGVPIVLEIYGIDVWQRTGGFLANLYARRVDMVVSISEITKQRFIAWSGCEDWKIVLLPNAIHAGLYGMGPKNPALLERYGLGGKVVLMTLGRIVSQERYKGFDEVLELLPKLSLDIPNVAYLVVGDGSDRRRLEDKAGELGVSDRVTFAGLIDESEKADHYRLADAYVMPSRGEGFGFVFLEAMACGIPVIGSIADGSREALINGALGTLVDPDDAVAIKGSILAAVQRPREIPKGLDYFSYANFERRVRHIVDRL
jgi:glycosyltransferase involved in cell wall biosynthesis